jgi:hypothetical protein
MFGTHHIGVALAIVLTVGPVPAQQRPASPENPLYLYAHFRDDDDVHLRLSFSRFAATDWADVNPAGSFTAPLIRDPSVMYVPNPDPGQLGTFYFLVTPAVGTNVQFFSSTDLVNFSPIAAIDIASMVPGATVAWAPEWWHDPQDGTDYFFVAVSTDPEGAVSSTAPMMPYLVPFSPATGAVTGNPIEIGLFLTTQNRTFDFFPYYDGSKYYLLYVDQQPGGSGGYVTQPIAYATSSKLAGPYVQQTFTGTDYFGLGSFHTEAPTIFRVAESGCVRIVFDTWTVSATGARQYAPVYRDSCPASGALFSQTSLVDGPAPLIISGSEHGTIIPLTDAQSAAIVYNAAAQTAGRSGLPESGSTKIKVSFPSFQ